MILKKPTLIFLFFKDLYKFSTLFVTPPIGGGIEPNIIILLNSDQHNWVSFDLPENSEWKILCNGDKADVKGLGNCKYNYNVPPLKGIILSRIK